MRRNGDCALSAYRRGAQCGSCWRAWQICQWASSRSADSVERRLYCSSISPNFSSRSSLMPGRLFSTACAMCQSSPMALHITIAPNGSVSQINRETSTTGTQLRIDSAATSSAMRLPSANCSTLERVCSVSWLKESTRRCAATYSFCEMIRLPTWSASCVSTRLMASRSAGPAASSMRWRASSVAWLSSRLNKAGEMSARRVIAWVRSLSPLARIVSIDMPVFERRAPELPAAAIDQHVGDHRAELPALGDLAQVRLALALGDLDQILVDQPRRLRQHRPGDGDVIVGGEAMDDIMRSIGDRRDVPAQLDPRAAFDMIDQADDDVVKQRGYILGHPVAAGQKQVSDALQDRMVAFGRIAFERDFELVNNLQCLRHLLSSAAGILPAVLNAILAAQSIGHTSKCDP